MSTQALKDKPTKRKCKTCKEWYEPKYSTTEPCPKYECRLVLYAKANKKLAAQGKKEKKEADRAKRIAKKEMKEKLKTLGDYEKEAKRVFQKWIRKRDEHQPCISCGTFKSTVFDGGHYKKAELYSGVIFNEQNCHKQCGKCNRYLGGNELNYRVGLINRIGEEAVLELEKLAQETRVYKFSKQELIGIRDKYKKLTRQ